MLAGSRNLPALGIGAGPDIGFADDGALIYDRTPTKVDLWRSGDGRELAKLNEPGYVPRLVAAGRSGASVAVAFSSAARGIIILVDPFSGREAILSSGSAAALAISPDGSLIAVADGRRLRLIPAGGGAGRSFSAGGGSDPVAELAFSGDGRRLAVAGGNFLDVFSIPDGHPLGRPLWVPGATIESIALNEDGSIIAAGSTDAAARV